MEARKSTYRIQQHERLNEPKKISVEGLRIGTWNECEVWLNHPSVSRLHAGIREINGCFYLTDLSPSNSTLLNGRLISYGETEALADADVIQIGPFFLEVGRLDDALDIRVTQQPGLTIGDARLRLVAEQAERSAAAAAPPTPASPEIADSLKLFWEKRAPRDKPPRQEQQPIEQPVSTPPGTTGKARFYWKPTSDLVRIWPLSIFIWAAVFVGATIWVLAGWFPASFSPGPLSGAHARAKPLAPNSIARKANAGACLTCHTFNQSFDNNCAGCHQTDKFIATVTPPHKSGQVGCVACHAEHLGENFSPREAAFRTCAECHDDRKVFRGVRMKTPHPETGFGYPVVAGVWTWRGLDNEEWASKPVKVREEVGKWPSGDEKSSRVAQFHALHVYRVRSVGGLTGSEQGEIQCNSCHNTITPEVDREMPRQKCAVCHTGLSDTQTGRTLIADKEPNCTSCHVQHIFDQRRRSEYLPAIE